MYGRTLIRSHQDSSSSIQTYKVGALAKYRCERGYKIIGDPLITCEENGAWGGKIPECVCKFQIVGILLQCFNKKILFQDVDCQTPQSIAKGTVTLSTNATYYGAAALYECFPKYKLDGVSRRLCSEDGTWGYETPACVEITCPVPDVNEHLIVDANKRLVGETAKFSCTKGRYLVATVRELACPTEIGLEKIQFANVSEIII